MYKPGSYQYRTIIKTESGLHRTDNEMTNRIVRAVLHRTDNEMTNSIVRAVLHRSDNEMTNSIVRAVLHRTDNEMTNSIVRSVLKSNVKIVETCKIDNIYTHINDRSLFLLKLKLQY